MRGRASDSSTTEPGIRKKTTFVTDSPGPAITEEDNINGGSIKSSSSYDASKISFQGKRALFESVPVPVRKPQALTSNNQETLNNMTPPTEAHSPLVETNRRLEDEVARLEQLLVLREEASRRLRERLESQMGVMEGELQGDVRRLVRDNTTKEEIIK